jgi:hypothetical protein
MPHIQIEIDSTDLIKAIKMSSGCSQTALSKESKEPFFFLHLHSLKTGFPLCSFYGEVVF